MAPPPSSSPTNVEHPAVPPRLPLAWSAFRRRLVWLKWLAPAGLVLLVILYEVGPSRWINDTFGAPYHSLAEILVYGTIGPVLTFLLLEYLGRWLEERETSELQAMILTQARETARIDRELNDNALQAMFATSVLLDSIKSSLPHLPPEVATQLQAADKSLDGAIHQLREHLLHPPK
jgi:signal transduction histidine kinase